MNFRSCSSVAKSGNLFDASSHESAFVRRTNATRRICSCLRFELSVLSSASNISLSITLLRSKHCSFSSSALIGAKYCCLNSGLERSEDRFSFCPLSFAFSYNFHGKLTPRFWSTFLSAEKLGRCRVYTYVSAWTSATKSCNISFVNTRGSI